MILTGKTIPQLPQLTSTTNTSVIPVHLLGTTYYSTILDFIKSAPFGTFYQNFIPATSSTLSIGSSSYKLSSITVNNVISTAITTTLINTNTVPTKGGTFAMLGDITGNTVGGGSEIFVSASSANSTFRSLSSSTPVNLSISQSNNLITFSAKTFITGATNLDSGINIFKSADTQTLTFRTLSSQTPTNLSISTNGDLILFSGKTFITGATNSNNGGIEVFKSADTQTLTFRTLSSTTPSLLIVSNGDGLITFTPRAKFSGAFSSMITQNASSANTVYIMSAETTEHSNGIAVVDKTKFTIQSAGTYNIQFSTQFEKTGNGSGTVDVWFRKNGNNIARSNSELYMAKNSNDKLIASWNYIDVFTGNTDYFEIAWAATSNDIRMAAITGLTNPTRPDIPSLIVTMFEV